MAAASPPRSSTHRPGFAPIRPARTAAFKATRGVQSDAYNRGEHLENIGAVGTVLHMADNYSALAVSLAFPLFSDSDAMWDLLARELDQLRSEFDRTR